MVFLTGELTPPTAYRDEPTPNDRLTVADGNIFSTFSFAEFLIMRLETCSTFGWKPGYFDGSLGTEGRLVSPAATNKNDNRVSVTHTA